MYFQAELDGKVVSFVVEDKTHTEMHGGQLERYRGVVGEDAIEEDLVKAVYFKTGYVFGDDRDQQRELGVGGLTGFGQGVETPVHDQRQADGGAQRVRALSHHGPDRHVGTRPALSGLHRVDVDDVRAHREGNGGERAYGGPFKAHDDQVDG